jgi:hypothetical protein
MACKTTLEELRGLLIDLEGAKVGDLPLMINETIARCNIAMIERAELINDFERACAVIYDTFGSGPPVNESEETMADWAEEFSDRYSPPPNRPVLKVVAK